MLGDDHPIRRFTIAKNLIWRQQKQCFAEGKDGKVAVIISYSGYREDVDEIYEH
jgi:hypothetical protein